MTRPALEKGKMIKIEDLAMPEMEHDSKRHEPAARPICRSHVNTSAFPTYTATRSASLTGPSLAAHSVEEKKIWPYEVDHLI